MRRALGGSAAALTWLVLATAPAAGHVEYVTDENRGGDPLEFFVDVVTEPTHAVLLGGGVLAAVAALGIYLRYRPFGHDFDVVREALADYDDLVPWMLRLSLGLPLVGAGFAGYLFSPAVTIDARLLQVAIGFLLLFGLATRAVAVLGLLSYLVALAFEPRLVLAFEYVPGFIAIAILGSGRPSADSVLGQVATTPGTVYRRIDPIHRPAAALATRVDPLRSYVPTVLRVGVGATFVLLGLGEKLANPGAGLAVVDKYDLTTVVPVDAGLWVVGAGLVEMGVGLAIAVGLFTRAAAGTAFLMLTLTLFGLPDDPVLAHVTLFGLTSALLVTGAGPLALDRWLPSSPRLDDSVPGTAADADD